MGVTLIEIGDALSTHFICAQPNGIEILKVSLVTSSACDHKIIIRISLFTRTNHTERFAKFNFWEAAGGFK